jgi:hypothetical protein
VEEYSATKKDKIMSSVGKCTELKIIILREIGQTQKDKNILSHVKSRGKKT